MAQSAFETLGLPVRFDLDLTQIERAFMARVAQAHPDLACSASETDAAALNEARRSLIDPEQRARAVLATRAPDAQAPPLSPAFLAEILEVRQEAEDAMASNDEETVERWRQWAADRRAAIISELETLLGGEPEPLDEARAQLAAGVLQQWRYFERMLEQVGVPAHGPDA